MELRANPFQDHGEWFWRDADQKWHGPYPTQLAALRALLRAVDPTPWEKFVSLVKEFLRS